MFWIYILLSFSTLCISLNAQVITAIPSPPDPNGAVEITFYADRGTAGLRGFNGDVYAHTGVITNRSTGPTDWRYVKTNWGQNTPETKLTKTATDRWRLTIPNIRAYYNVPQNEEILQLTFVFRSANSTQEGKDVGAKDIYLPVLRPGAIPYFKSPTQNTVNIEQNESLSIEGRVQINGTALKSFQLFAGDSLVKDVGTDTVIQYTFTGTTTGTKELILKTIDTSNLVKTTSLTVLIVAKTKEQPLPPNVKEGLTFINDSTVVFCLFAPYHKTVHLIGDFNDYKILPEYQFNRMTIDKDSAYYWMSLSGLKIGTEYGYQYVIDGSIVVADPYAKKILSEFNDDEIITQNRYPNLKRYPKDKTDEFLSVFTMRPASQKEEFPFSWKNEFKRFPAKDLVIYELLVRDFTDRRTFRAVIDSLEYLKKLGVNAIQLMPIHEFEGNISWGYDPAFPYAVDKYYGTELELKELIDKAHGMGMAMILDLVHNHLTGANPLIRMWADGKYGPPSTINPYANVTAKHPFNVFNDMNHESIAYQRYIDGINEYWIREFKFDGYRFDLSKGFTQVDYGNNTARWSSYDSSRIRLLKRMYNRIRNYDSSAYLILEHFADSREERELTDYGYMIWHNMNPTSSEAVMGWISGQSDNGTSQVYFANRSLNVPANVAYMESHDEERLIRKNFCYGKAATGYTTRDTTIALQRAGAMAAMFFPIPGPRMIWQFGEIGYDVGLQLNESCTDNASIRLNVKPTRWNYLNDARRKRLYDTYSALLALRSYPTFSSLQSKVTFKASRVDTLRTVLLEHPEMDAYIIANFDMKPRTFLAKVPKPGTWYDYFTGSSIDISAQGNALTMQPGQFHVLTSKQLPKPTVQAWPITSIDGEEQSSSTIFPHPLQSGEQGIISLKKAGGIGRIYDMKGVLIDSKIMQDAQVQIGPYAIGAYVFVHHAVDGSVIATHPFIIQ
ncbi:MAG: alpha-amylase family glycosyl hydrolase [Candidatus Kapaibacteriota bacterium]